MSERKARWQFWIDRGGTFTDVVGKRPDSTLATLKQTVEKKDGAAFTMAYKQMIESCYACHKSSGKPYLRPMIPTVTPQPIINYDPNATWPE